MVNDHQLLELSLSLLLHPLSSTEVPLKMCLLKCKCKGGLVAQWIAHWTSKYPPVYNKGGGGYFYVVVIYNYLNYVNMVAIYNYLKYVNSSVSRP